MMCSVSVASVVTRMDLAAWFRTDPHRREALATLMTTPTPARTAFELITGLRWFTNPDAWSVELTVGSVHLAYQGHRLAAVYVRTDGRTAVYEERPPLDLAALAGAFGLGRGDVTTVAKALPPELLTTYKGKHGGDGWDGWEPRRWNVVTKGVDTW